MRGNSLLSSLYCFDIELFSLKVSIDGIKNNTEVKAAKIIPIDGKK